MVIILKSFGFSQTPHQLIRDFIALNPHHALFRTAVTEEVNAAVPDDFLIDNGKFLMDVRFVNQVNARIFYMFDCFGPGG